MGTPTTTLHTPIDPHHAPHSHTGSITQGQIQACVASVARQSSNVDWPRGSRTAAFSQSCGHALSHKHGSLKKVRKRRGLCPCWCIDGAMPWW